MEFSLRVSPARVARMACVLAWSLVVAQAQAQSQPPAGWVSVMAGNCSLYLREDNHRQNPNLRRTWEGPCTQGVANGFGILRVYDSGRMILISKVQLNNGIAGDVSELYGNFKGKLIRRAAGTTGEIAPSQVPEWARELMAGSGAGVASQAAPPAQPTSTAQAAGSPGGSGCNAAAQRWSTRSPPPGLRGCDAHRWANDNTRSFGEPVLQACGVDSPQGQEVVRDMETRIRIYGRQPRSSGFADGQPCGFNFEFGGLLASVPQLRASQANAGGSRQPQSTASGSGPPTESSQGSGRRQVEAQTAHDCLRPIPAGQGKIFARMHNRCEFTVNYDFCVQNPSESGAIDCQKEVSSGASLEGFSETIHHFAGQRVFWYACKHPARPRHGRWDGNAITARCEL